MIVWTRAVLGVLYTCVLYFRICTCPTQLSMFHMERSSRNTVIIINVSIVTLVATWPDVLGYRSVLVRLVRSELVNWD